MSFKKDNSSTMQENINPFTILEEKDLKGGDNDVLRKVRLDKVVVVNNIRLYLSKKGLHTSVIFGGNVQALISPENYDELFDLIDSKWYFYDLSETIRSDLNKLLGS